MRSVRLSVKAIIIREGRLLVLKCRDEDGVWYALPGGGQVAGETLDEAFKNTLKFGGARCMLQACKSKLAELITFTGDPT